MTKNQAIQTTATGYKIHTMTRTDSGHYNLSGNIAPDLFDDNLPQCNQLDEVLNDMGYSKAEKGAFVGWGDVYTSDCGDMICVAFTR